MSVNDLRKALAINEYQKKSAEEKDKLRIEGDKKTLEYSKTLENLDNRIEIKDFAHFKYGLGYTFQIMNDKKMIVNDFNRDFLATISAYFYKDESFLNSSCVLNRPDFNKGLLISGSYGLGKSIIMETFQKLGRLVKVDNMNYKIRSCNSVVMEYETLQKELSQREFFEKITKGEIYFDDFGTEDIANKFGKKELMKVILEERYSKKMKTHITTNLGMKEISERYGERICDRLPEMFNLISVKGKSFRN